MATGSTTRVAIVSKRHCTLLFATTAMTYLLITMGGVVCVSESGRACPDWPGCYGRMVPIMRVDAVIEYSHRCIAVLTLVLVIAAALLGLRRARSAWWVSVAPTVALAFLLAVAGFGAVAVLRGLSPAAAAVDLGLALLVLGALVTASTVARTHQRNSGLPDRLSFQSPLAKLSLWIVAAVFVVLVSGAVIDSGSVARCLGWPLHRVLRSASGPGGRFRQGRDLAAALTSVLIFAVVFKAWVGRGRQPELARGAVLLGSALALELCLGTIMWAGGIHLFLLVPYVACAAGIWASSIYLATLFGLAPCRGENFRQPAERSAG